MRAISRPRKTDAIATYRLHKQKWAARPIRNKTLLNRMPVARGHLTFGPTPARGRVKLTRAATHAATHVAAHAPKKQKPLGGLFLTKLVLRKSEISRRAAKR